MSFDEKLKIKTPAKIPLTGAVCPKKSALIDSIVENTPCKGCSKEPKPVKKARKP